MFRCTQDQQIAGSCQNRSSHRKDYDEAVESTRYTKHFDRDQDRASNDQNRSHDIKVERVRSSHEIGGCRHNVNL